MADIFISHARENRAACMRLAETLECLGLSVDWDRAMDANTHSAGQIEAMIASADATIVLWSHAARESGQVRAEAIKARELRRDIGVIVDDLAEEQMPLPYNNIDIANMRAWFDADQPSFESTDAARLFARLEIMARRPALRRIAAALAARDVQIHDAELERTRLNDEIAAHLGRAAALDSDLSEARHRAESLEQTAQAQIQAISRHEHDLATATASLQDAEARLAALSSRHDLVTAQIDQLRSELQSAQTKITNFENEIGALRLEAADRASQMSAAQDLSRALNEELTATQVHLTTARDQRERLQKDLAAADINLGAAIEEREKLRVAKDDSDRIVKALRNDLSWAKQRAESEEGRRAVYEVSLVERDAELRGKAEALDHAKIDISTLRATNAQLAAAVKEWKHVPWRRMAVGGLAAGALLTYGVALGGKTLEQLYAPAQPQTADAAPTVPTARAPLAAAPFRPETTPAGQDRDIIGDAPPNFSVVDPTAPPPDDHSPVDPNAAQAGIEQPAPAIAPVGSAPRPRPMASTSPIAKEEPVQFNPDGLPPVDPDERPPPQDLPPMQQKPKLQLKPPVPVATGEPRAL